VQQFGRQRQRHGQFEVATHGGGGEGGIIPDGALADHQQGFGDDEVGFAGHDGGAGLDGREVDFTQAGNGAGGHPADVIGDFGQRDGEGFEGGVVKAWDGDLDLWIRMFGIAIMMDLPLPVYA
jgi:hypothetical protein